MAEYRDMSKQEVLLLRRKLDLLLRTGKLLVESAADTNRIDRNMKRVAAFLGIPEDKLHLDIRWSMIMVNVSDEAHSFSKFQKCEKHGINMTAITEISKLSWRAIEQDYSLDRYEEELERIAKQPRNYKPYLVAICAGFACGGFCKLFGGDWIAFLDGDDEWHPEYLAIIQKTIIKYPNAGMICTAGECCSINNKSKYSYRIAKKYINQIRLINFFENPCVFSHTSGLTINKKIFYKTHGFPVGMKCCEDYACTQAIALISPTIYIGLPISKYNGGVEGQITSIDASTRFKYLKYVVDYYNLVMNDYIISNQKNKLFKIYFKYDIRHRIKGFIIGKDYKSLDFFIDNLSSENKKLLFRTEIQMYKKRYNLLSVLWILLTKCIWRIHNFPVVGEKINTRKINSKYLSW